MKCGIASSIMISLLLFGMLTFAFSISLVRATGTIYIRADGSVEPPTKLIQRDGDLYTFTSDIYDEIVVEKDDIIIDGNGYTLHGTGAGNGFFLCERTNVTIENVRIVQFYTGIYLGYCTGINMAGNTLKSNIQGINLEKSTSCKIGSNGLISCEGGIIGIIVDKLTIEDNLLVDSSNVGIELSMADWCTIAGNTLISCEGGVIGIIVNHLTIQENIMDSSNFAIDLSMASWCTIAGNNIANNLDGVRLSYSSSNIIYHNNFVNNNQHVYSYESVNTWDADYPCGGNYWSGYHGEDNFRGVKQDQPRSDAIGDNPYKIDENNLDRYPLMESWSPSPMVRIFIRLVFLWDLSKGRENSLTSKLYEAIHLFNTGNENGAVRKFVDFTNAVLTLQEAMQKQQQIYQQLSNIMKSMHDTAQSIINNMRA